MALDLTLYENDIRNTVKQALLEDIGDDLQQGDITAHLIPALNQA